MKNLNLKACKMFFYSAICLCFVLSISLPAAAQKMEEPKREFMIISVITVKPGMGAEFDNIIKTEYNPAFTKGGGTISEVWQPVFGNQFEYFFVQPIGEKFVVMDSPSPLAKGMGKDGLTAFLAKASKMITSFNTFVVQTRPDMSYTTEMTAPPRFAVVMFMQVKSGKNNELVNFAKNDYLPLVKKSGVKGFWVSQVIFGGNPNEYISLTLQDSFADLDKGNPLNRVNQEDAAKVVQKFPDEIIENTELSVMYYNPALSIRPSAPPMKK